MATTEIGLTVNDLLHSSSRFTTVPNVYEFGPFQLDVAERRLLREGVQIPLRSKVFETLVALVENAGRLMTKDVLLEKLWPDVVVEENNLQGSISILRKILGEDNDGDSYIETVPRVGYRFKARVTEIGAGSTTKLATHLSSASRAEKSVAVLYFENLGGDKEDEYFRDGITEDVITELAKIKELRIFPRSAVLGLKDKPLPLTEIGRQLRAAFILEGTVRRASGQLRVTAQLVEAASGHAVWAERYDRRMEDVFAIQDEIAQNIARALRVVLNDTEKKEIQKIPTHHVQAYDYYLRGRQVIFQYRRKSMEFARQMFARAAVIDPGYAAAFAGVADCSSFLYMYFESSEDNLREATSASERAVELDPESAEAHASRGLAISLSRCHDEAQQEFDTAIRLNPNLFEPYYYRGRAYFAEGKLAEAALAFDLASDLNPDDFQSASLAGTAYMGLGRRFDALARYRRAQAAAAKRLELDADDVRALYSGAQSLYHLGDRSRSLEWAARAIAAEPNEPAVLYNIACVQALQGQREDAITSLERAVKKGYSHREWILNDSDLDGLRGIARFESLLKGLGLTGELKATNQ